LEGGGEEHSGDVFEGFGFEGEDSLGCLDVVVGGHQLDEDVPFVLG
jgi:hypothetical protein